MAEKLKDVMARNAVAAAELDEALRDCLAEVRARPETVVEGRLRLISGGRKA